MWPFGARKKHIDTRKDEIEELRLSVSADRYELHKNLIKLDDAAKALDAPGVRGMLNNVFQRLDEGKNRG